MIIEAVQYHFPNGRKENITGEVSDDLKSQWTALTAAGLVLEMEVLPRRAGTSDGTPLVHITLTDPGRGDYADQLVPNDKDLIRTVEDMIRTFDPEDFGAWRALWDAEAAEERNDDFMTSIDGDDENA